VTSTTTDDQRRGNASALVTTPGVPWWGAVLIALVPTTIGLGIDLKSSASVGVLSWVLTLLGMIAATLAVRRHSVFTAMVQPPLVLALGVVIAYVVMVSTRVLGIGLTLINAFPLMLVATAASLILGMVRIIAQPLRRPTATRI
jgi:hypothetical protein